MGFYGMTFDLNPKYANNSKDDPELAYLRKLSQAKRVANDYFLNGRVMRDLPH